MANETHGRRREQRAARLAALPWLHTDTMTGRPVRRTKNEVLVAVDHERAARAALASAGVAPSSIAALSAVPGFVRLAAPGVDPEAVTSALPSGAAAANHVFMSNPFEMGGPFGPPVTAATYPLDGGPAEDAAVRLTVLDTAVWSDSPLPSHWYETDDLDDELDVGTDLGHANFIIGVVMSRTDNARVRAIKVLDADGLCTEVDLARALFALTDVDVVNLSLGGFTRNDRPPLLLAAALTNLLRGKDRVVVAAAGNEGISDRPYWPAAFAGTSLPWASQVIAVAAHDGTELCEWSNSGSWVDVTAPGADVTSTYVTHEDFPTGFAKWSGTSFAAPYAAAAIASHHRTAGSVVGAADLVRKEATERTFGGLPGLA
ncbi:S8 family serine peptidase [Dactylosporangium sp. NPDC050688]|uniref:S8 family peptidase n=1 Tax=Dactylosporangium sp. NPDC050688 TaxID=3157217 RepID=UPI0033C8F299